MREALRLEQALDLNRSGNTHAREVVAPEVDEHHVLGAVLLRGEQALGVTLPRMRRSRDRVQARAPALGLDERFRRGADECEPVELEQEEVWRRVDAPKGAVDLERRCGRRPLRALGEDDLERIAGADVPLGLLDRPLILEAPGGAPRALVVPVSPSPGRKHSQLAAELRGDFLLVSAEHVREPRHVIEADEHVGDDEAALREVAPCIRQLDGRLEASCIVVGEVAHDGLATGLGLVDVDEPRAVADEGVASEAPALDGLEQERGATVVGAQPEVGPERGDEIGCDDCFGIHVGFRFGQQKRPPSGKVYGRNGLVGLHQIRRCSRPARGASTRPSSCAGQESLHSG